MTTYTLQGPSGKTYTVEGPEGATADQLGQVILANSREERGAAEYQREKAEYDPTNDMTTGQRTLAGVGRGMTSVGRALSQLNPFGGTTQADVDAAKQSDAPLLATRAGKVGNVLGAAAATAPVMWIPGANTYAGAATIGAGLGALTTEGDLKDRAIGAGTGALGGVVGKGAGDAIGLGVGAARSAVANKLAARQVANATKDAATTAAQDAGYVVTPSQSGSPGVIGSVAEALGGKIKTQQQASVANQKVTNKLAAQTLGLPEDQSITINALDALRKDAGTAYGDVAGLGTLDAGGAKLPPGLATTASNRLTLAPETTVDAAKLVQAWRQANADATGLYRKFGRSADPADQTAAKVASSDAKSIGDFIEQAVTQREGRSVEDLTKDLALKRITPEEFIAQALNNSLVQSGAKPAAAQALRDARVLIAKSHSVENALNPATGDVLAPKLAAQLNKGKVLSGGLQQAGEFAQAFPRAAQAGVDVPHFSPLDTYSVAEGLGQGNWLQALATLLRAPARSAALSGPVQRGFTKYETNPLLQGAAKLTNDPRVNALQQLLGTSVGVELPQQ